MPDTSTDSQQAEQAPITLTAQQAEVLLRADLRNLAIKVQQGKTLTAAERNILQSAASGGPLVAEAYAKNQVELATILNVDRKTIQRGLKREGNPGIRPDGRLDIAAWRIFLKKDSRYAKGLDDEPMSQTRLKAEQILLQNQKLEVQLAVLKREYVPFSEVENWGGELGAAIRKIVSQIHLKAPSVVGLSAPEAEALLKECEDEILAQLHSLDDRLTGWRDEPAS